MSSEEEQRHPDWREYPSAISECVFYVASSQQGDSKGKWRYRSGPDRVLEDGNLAIWAKGDFVPDFEYSSFSTMVFEDLQGILSDNLDANTFNEGATLLRFVAFARTEDWHLETAYEEVEDILATASFATLDIEDEDWLGNQTDEER